MHATITFLALFLAGSLYAYAPALYTQISKTDLPSLLAYAYLYPTTAEGQKALIRSWVLLGESGCPTLPLPTLLRQTSTLLPATHCELTDHDVAWIEWLGRKLSNRTLQGHAVATKEAILTLPSEQIDLAHALLLWQDPSQMRRYEAQLDLFALEILANLMPQGGPNAPAPLKIRAMNNLIFQRLHFRFPPHASYAPRIDEYTFLPSVIDKRLGVCLGVTLLYISLAQRLGLPLEIITPPGHIFPRFVTGECCINIETTARGANLPSEIYLGINTKALQSRNLRDLIGLVYINAASIYVHQKEPQKAIEAYKIAELFLPNEPLIWEYLAYQLLFDGQEEAAKEYLIQALQAKDPFRVAKETVVEDLLLGHADKEAVQAILESVDATQESILRKQRILQETIARCPQFREGWMQLAVTWIQLERGQEALDTLNKLLVLDPNNPTLHYYLAVLSLDRLDIPAAKRHTEQLTQLLQAANHSPSALCALQLELRQYP